MGDPGLPTLDQLRVFIAVVEAGGFAAAARRLHRAPSVVSYTIQNLEQQLGVVLFDRDSTKRPQLTREGRVVLAEAQSVASRVDALRAKVGSMQRGVEPEVHLALDVMLPAERVVAALKAFREAFTSVALRLSAEALWAVTELVLARAATVGVAGPLAVAATGLERIGVGEVALIPVAAADHPLAAGPLAPGAAREHVQLVLTDRSRLTAGVDFGVSSPRTWRLADLGAKHMLLREGIGWGNMPEPMVREDLASGRLVRLDQPDLAGETYRLQAIYLAATPPGPAARFLIAEFERQAGAPD